MSRDLKFSELSHVERATLILALRDRAEQYEQRAAAHSRPEYAAIDRAEAERTRAVLVKVWT